MISYIKGKVHNKGKGYVIVLTNNLGYKVYVNEGIYVDTDINQEVEFYTFHNIKEDISDLYGFYSLEQLEMFELLLTISGVGPKSAMAAMGIAKLEDIQTSIANGDPSLLVKVSGIGKKTAERIVLELRDKVGVAGIESSGTGLGASSDEIDGLMALGYSLQQAREALSKVDSQVSDSGERIKAALRSLSS